MQKAKGGAAGGFCRLGQVSDKKQLSNGTKAAGESQDGGDVAQFVVIPAKEGVLFKQARHNEDDVDEAEERET